jgi:hypothetical protein
MSTIVGVRGSRGIARGTHRRTGRHGVGRPRLACRLRGRLARCFRTAPRIIIFRARADVRSAPCHANVMSVLGRTRAAVSRDVRLGLRGRRRAANLRALLSPRPLWCRRPGAFSGGRMPQSDVNDPEVDAARRLRRYRQGCGACRRTGGREHGSQDSGAYQSANL